MSRRHPDSAAASRPARGFTLIEVLAVLFLTSIVMGVALNFYVDLSNQGRRAAESTREVGRAASLLDRLARDFEGALLEQKPDETDPLAHPWIFVAESRRSEGGADRVKFIARRLTDYRSAGAANDLAVVTYALREGKLGEDLEIVRWSTPYVPGDFDPDFPPVDDAEALLLADGISRFVMRFQGDDGEWVEDWDSSQLLESSALPVAVEIEVALASPDRDDAFEAAALSESYRRRVLLPVRPLDFETLLDPVAYAASGGGEAESQCELTVADCVDLAALGVSGGGAPGPQDGPPPDLTGLLKLSPEEREAIRALQGGNLANMCWSAFRDAYGDHPAVRPECR